MENKKYVCVCVRGCVCERAIEQAGREKEREREGLWCLADRRDVLRREESCDKGSSAHDS